MPNSTVTNYLQETYRILVEIPDFLATKDNYKDCNNKIDTSTVFKDIVCKVKAEEQNNVSKLSIFEAAWNNFKNRSENTEIRKIVNKPIHILIVNPAYKHIVADLIERINVELVFDEMQALSLIKQQLQEFFELSRLADYASYGNYLSIYKNIGNLLTLAAMAKLQLCFAMDNLKKYFSHKKDNQEIKAIAATIISYLGQSAIAEDYPSTNTILNYFDTNLEAVKKSFEKDKHSLQSDFDVYLKNVKIKQNEEINDVDEIYYDALDQDDDKKFLDIFDESEIFSDAFETLPKKKNKTDLSASAQISNEPNSIKNSPKKDNIQSDFEKMILILKKIIFILSIISSIEKGGNLFINFLIVNRKGSRKSANCKFNPGSSDNLNPNYSAASFFDVSNGQGEDPEIHYRSCRFTSS